MSKSKIIFDKFAKLFEQGLLTYKDLSSEIINILKSNRHGRSLWRIFLIIAFILFLIDDLDYSNV